MTPDKLDQLRRFARAAKQGGTLGGPASIANGVLLLCDEVERLTAERDADRAEIVALCEERLQLKAERDEARAEAERHLGHLRTAHPAHFTPNVLGERLCGCGGQWPCPTERDELEQARAALDRVRALRERCDQGARDNGDYYKRTSAKYEHGKAVVWDHVATELKEILAALDGSGT